MAKGQKKEGKGLLPTLNFMLSKNRHKILSENFGSKMQNFCQKNLYFRKISKQSLNFQHPQYRVLKSNRF